MGDPSGQAEALATALGALVINFAALEESLHDAIWAVAGGSPAVSVLTAGLPFRTLVEKFAALRRDVPLPSVPQSQVEAYCAGLLNLNDRRNKLVHSSWRFREVGEAPRRARRRVRAKTGLTLETASVAPSQIHALAEELRLAEQKLWDVAQ
jgi:hypothetical protein